jgi:hypothetical protein
MPPCKITGGIGWKEGNPQEKYRCDAAQGGKFKFSGFCITQPERLQARLMEHTMVRFPPPHVSCVLSLQRPVKPAWRSAVQEQVVVWK